MIAKIAYLTSPAPARFILNFQCEIDGGEQFFKVEVSKAHLANILIDGLSFSLRESSIHRVIETSHTESADERIQNI